MAKYIDLPNLKENLTNFLNKKINPIYAKKTEIPSNISELNNDKSYQTAEEVGQAVTDGVAKIVAGAPEDFDTLKEMSDWISSHETSAAAMNSAISDNSVAIANHTSNSDIHVTKEEKTKWDNKVDSIEGKTLSNNNFLYKYKDTLDKMPTTYQYKTHYNKEDGTFNMVSINAGSQGTDPQTFQKYTLPSNYKDIFDGVNSKIEDLALNGVYSNKANIDEVNSNLSALDNSKLKGYTIEYNVPANKGGWHKIAQITGGYFNFDLYATGSWSAQRKSNAHFQIQNISGTVRIVQLSGLADGGGGINKIRMIRVVDDRDTWILEEHSSSSSNGEFFRFTIAGDVTVTPLDGSVDTTTDTDFKDSVSLDVVDVPTGSVITTSSVDNALSSNSVNPVQNKVVKAEFDKVNSNLYTLAYDENAGWKNLFRNYDHMGYYAFIDETYNGYPVIYSSNQWDGAIQTNLVLETGKTYTVSAYVKGSGEVGLFYGKLMGTVLRKTLTSDWQRAVWTFTPDTDSANTDSGSGNVRIEQIVSGGKTYISCFQIEEGDTATPYEPYIPSVKMLAEENAQQNNSLISLGKCKNLLKPTLQTTTQNGVTCTNNGDGTYTLNGTASGLTTFILRDMKLDSSLSYKLTGCPLGGDWDNGYSMYVEKQYWGIDVGKGYEITLTDASNICGVYIRIIKDTVCNNLVFKPMLTTNLDATYDDFVPYTGDGDTLTADVAEVKNDLDKLNSLPIGSIIQIEEDKDDIETTTQKYGWQYLGKSKIECENGSIQFLVTNVYRKNN